MQNKRWRGTKGSWATGYSSPIRSIGTVGATLVAAGLCIGICQATSADLPGPLETALRRPSGVEDTRPMVCENLTFKDQPKNPFQLWVTFPLAPVVDGERDPCVASYSRLKASLKLVRAAPSPGVNLFTLAESNRLPSVWRLALIWGRRDSAPGDSQADHWVSEQGANVRVDSYQLYLDWLGERPWFDYVGVVNPETFMLWQGDGRGGARRRERGSGEAEFDRIGAAFELAYQIYGQMQRMVARYTKTRETAFSDTAQSHRYSLRAAVDWAMRFKRLSEFSTLSPDEKLRFDRAFQLYLRAWQLSGRTNSKGRGR